MIKYFFSYFFLSVTALFAALSFNISDEPIDVVIPCITKDKATLEHCINGIRKNGKNIGKIYTISPKRLTRNAEWVSEDKFPFSKFTIALNIFKKETAAKTYLKKRYNRIGWVLQQFIKLYAPYVIPNLSSTYLVLDSDVIFVNPVEFVKDGRPLYYYSDEYHKPYFAYMSRLIPGLEKVFPNKSGICHHMLFSRSVLDSLMTEIRTVHNKAYAWRAMIDAIDINELNGSCLSEYELYFNYIFSRSKQPQLRALKWKGIHDKDLANLKAFQEEGYDFVHCPHYQQTVKHSPRKFAQK